MRHTPEELLALSQAAANFLEAAQYANNINDEATQAKMTSAARSLSDQITANPNVKLEDPRAEPQCATDTAGEAGISPNAVVERNGVFIVTADGQTWINRAHIRLVRL